MKLARKILRVGGLLFAILFALGLFVSLLLGGGLLSDDDGSNNLAWGSLEEITVQDISDTVKIETYEAAGCQHYVSVETAMYGPSYSFNACAKEAAPVVDDGRPICLVIKYSYIEDTFSSRNRLMKFLYPKLPMTMVSVTNADSCSQ